MSETVGRIFFELGADISDFEKKLGEAAKQTDIFSKETVRKFELAGAAMAAAMTAAVAVLVGKSMESVDALGKLADRVGSSVAGIQALEKAGKLAGLSQDQVTQAADRLNKSLGEAALKGSGPAHDALVRLGLDANNLSKMDADERFATLADRMKDLGYSAPQVAATLKDLGIRTGEVANLMSEGGSAIRGARTELDEYGESLSRVDAKKVEQANDAMGKVVEVVEGIFNRLAVKFAPLIEDIANRFLGLAKDTHGFQDALDAAFSFGVSAVGVMADGVHTLGIGFNALVAIAQTIRYAFVGAFSDIMDVFVGVNDGILQGVNATIRGINSAFGTSFKEIGLLADSTFVKGVHEGVENVRQDMVDAWKHVQDLLMEPLPSDGLKKWVKDVTDAATKAAQASVAAHKAAVDQTSDADKKAEDKLRAEADKKMQTLQQQLQTEADLRAAFAGQNLTDEQKALAASTIQSLAAEETKWNERLAIINENFALNLKSQDEWQKEIDQAYQSHIDNIGQIAKKGGDARAKFEAMSWDKQAQDIASSLEQITAGVSTHNRTLFEINKASGIASSVINTYEAITKSLAKFGMPWAIPFMAASAAAGLAQVQAISGTSYGGGGRGSAPSTAGSTSAQPVSNVPQSQSTLVIEGLNPGQLFSGDAVRQLAGQLTDFYKDGGGSVVFK